MRRVLVANRGEIAVRVIRACRLLGLESVAVYAEADREAPHVALADRAVPLAGSTAVAPYLTIATLLEAARVSGADAVHPGYGFLAERADFAAAVEAAGLVFVGPTAETMAALGDKVAARRLAARVGVPVLPGVELAEGAEPAAAAGLDYPLVVKASAGGGGRGLRVVERPADLVPALEGARREALAAFGDGTVYLERWLPRARHVEVQVLGDGRGGLVHLGERECSIQRRHQKLLEESPSPAVTPALRRQLTEAALALARAVGYRSAGTVEFLLDEAGRFYFLEVNTRLQVEHPVTEWVTGLDLVALQLRLAAGEALPLAQRDVTLAGHALECRLVAEDPASGFRPATGRVHVLEWPTGPGVRVDAGIAPGSVVGSDYDSLLAKLSTWGETREAARRRMLEALRATTLLGVATVRDLHLALLEDPAFVAGDTHIRFLEARYAAWRPPAPAGWPALLAAAALARAAEPRAAAAGAGPSGAGPSPWQTLGPFRLGEGR
ncbi:MAG TPA: biotin carboxylase N-terminal domain-containing protein [Thermodesulfobacteriota bacterium]